MLFSNPVNFSKRKAPKIPAGKERITDNGRIKLSYCAANTK